MISRRAPRTEQTAPADGASNADVLVIGGGPAGLATAIAAAQLGLSVQVAEGYPGTPDKCCGEGLLPLAVAALERLGISKDDLVGTGCCLAGITFKAGMYAPAARFHGSAAAFGLRRTTLQMLLTARARELGVTLLAKHARLTRTASALSATINGTVSTPRWIVGADGAQSAVRSFVGLDAGRLVSRRYALRQHFLLADRERAPDGVVVHWAAGAQAYVTPVGPRLVGVAVLAQRKLGSMEAALEPFPALTLLLQGAVPCTRVRGAISVHRTLRRVHCGQVALVGDAAGGVDAVTGDGLAIAFQQALALAEAMRSCDLRQYQAAHDRILRRPRIFSRMLLALSRRSALLRGSLFALDRAPALFAALLHLHTSKKQPSWCRPAAASFKGEPALTKPPLASS